MTKRVAYSDLITSYDNTALADILQFWDSYDTKSVLLAYAEYNRRCQCLTEDLQTVIYMFLLTNDESSIDVFLRENCS